MRTEKTTEITLEMGDRVRLRSPGLCIDIKVDTRGEEKPPCRTYMDIRQDGEHQMSIEQVQNGRGLTVIGVSN